MKLYLALIGYSLLLVGALYGQSAKTPTREVSLYAFDHHPKHQTVFLETAKGDPYEIALSKANILGPFKTVMDENREVTIRGKEKDAEGVIIYPELMKVSIPAGFKEPLLILFPVNNEKIYAAIAIDRSLSTFPQGSYKLLNLSPYEIRASLGNTEVLAVPKKLTSFNLSRNPGRQVDVHFEYEISEKWKTFGRTSWIKQPDKRTLLCAYLDPRRKRMRIRGVDLQSIKPLRDRQAK